MMATFEEQYGPWVCSGCGKPLPIGQTFCDSGVCNPVTGIIEPAPQPAPADSEHDGETQIADVSGASATMRAGGMPRRGQCLPDSPSPTSDEQDLAERLWQEFPRFTGSREESIAAIRRVLAADQERVYRECAGLMCSHCAEGDEPKWMVVFQGMTHTWKIGNGHSQCNAGPIWERLRELSREKKR